MIRRWLLPWRRQKAQSVAPPAPTAEIIELAGVFSLAHGLQGNTELAVRIDTLTGLQMHLEGSVTTQDKATGAFSVDLQIEGQAELSVRLQGLCLSSEKLEGTE